MKTRSSTPSHDSAADANANPTPSLVSLLHCLTRRRGGNRHAHHRQTHTELQLVPPLKTLVPPLQMFDPPPPHKGMRPLQRCCQKRGSTMMITVHHPHRHLTNVRRRDARPRTTGRTLKGWRILQEKGSMVRVPVQHPHRRPTNVRRRNARPRATRGMSTGWGISQRGAVALHRLPTPLQETPYIWETQAVWLRWPQNSLPNFCRRSTNSR